MNKPKKFKSKIKTVLPNEKLNHQYVRFNINKLYLRNVEELILESSILLKNDLISHVNPVLLVQTLKRFIGVIKKVKKLKVSNKLFNRKPILLYSDNKYVRQMLNLGIKKYYVNRSAAASSIEVGGIKQLISSAKFRQRYSLVVFVDRPMKMSIDFCLKNRIYLMSFFVNRSYEKFNGIYKLPFVIETIKRYFWLIALIESI